MTFNAGQTFKEKMLEKAHEFIKNHVPQHTQAEYEALLATNADLAIELISKWQQLEDLKAAYYQLQKEAVANVPMPPVKAEAGVYRLPMERLDQFEIRWGMDPFRARLALMEDPHTRFDRTPEVARAFHRVFHEEFVPQLWDHTANVLGMASGKAAMAWRRAA